MIDLEDNVMKIGDYLFERHEGDLYVAPFDHILLDYDWNEIYHPDYEMDVPTLVYHPVDLFSDLIDALNYFKERGLEVKLNGEDFKKLVEGVHASGTDWVNFNRYDFIKDYGAFRRLVLIRDDYKCLCCGNDNEKDLQVHHIRAFKDNLELATSVKNGATLCKDCHTKYHKKYGWKGKQETFSKFIKEMLD